jgi:hypothetical protein
MTQAAKVEDASLGAAGAAKAEELDGRPIALCREFEAAEATLAAWDVE